MAALETLVDTFGGTLSLWTAGGSPAPTIVSGRCQIFCNWNLCRIDSATTYDSTNSYILWEHTIELDSGSNPSTDTWSECKMTTGSSGTRARVSWTTGGTKTLEMRKSSAGTPTSITWDPVAHRWIRIRETATDCYVDTAPDGLSWTQRFTDAIDGSPTSRTVRFSTNGNAGTNTAKTYLDNVNAPPAAATKRMKVWTGSSWTAGTLKVWNGSSWTTGAPKVWNGSTWV